MQTRKTRYPTECNFCKTISPRNYQRCGNCVHEVCLQAYRWLLNTDLQRKSFAQLVKELAGRVVNQKQKPF